MSRNPWFRFYSETLSDRKVARVCRISGQSKAAVIGVWAILLSLANESPQRGRLLISDDLELTPDEIREETGLDANDFDAIIIGLTQFGLIITDGCWEICNWDKRQFISDNSAERVRKHRAEQRNVSPPVVSDNSVTLHSRYSIVLDTDTETETETEGETERASAASSPSSSPDIQAIGSISNALTEVTGVSSKLNRQAMYEFSADLHAAGYTAAQVLRHYGGEPAPGAWNWYVDDWRGARGDKPNLKNIRETIAGAIVDTPKVLTVKAQPLKSVSTPAPGSQPVTW